MLTSECVSLGHPDKIADYISEYILDRLIEQDPKTRYALEVQVKDNNVTLAGEVTTNAKTNYCKWVKDAVVSIGYTEEYADKWGNDNTINPSKINVVKNISEQSSDIALGVNTGGWGDQGIMFGLAINSPETDFMPKDYFIAKKLCASLFDSGLGGLDIKTQVSVDLNNKIRDVVVAIPLLDSNTSKVNDFVHSIVPGDYNLIINGTGKYIKHSSMGDCGTTGRKLAVDFYGGNCEIGGGSPWTKDGTKADLTLNLYARDIALTYLNLFQCDYAKIRMSCCIGKETINVSCINKENTVSSNFYVKQNSNTLIERYSLDKPVFSKMCRDGLFYYVDRLHK